MRDSFLDLVITGGMGVFDRMRKVLFLSGSFRSCSIRVLSWGNDWCISFVFDYGLGNGNYVHDGISRVEL